MYKNRHFAVDMTSQWLTQLALTLSNLLRCLESWCSEKKLGLSFICNNIIVRNPMASCHFSFESLQTDKKLFGKKRNYITTVI